MKVPKSFQRDLKLINPHLNVIWNSLLERFQIIWMDLSISKPRIVLTVENDDGSFRPCDFRSLIVCSQQVSWDTLYKYPTAEEMSRYFLDKFAKEKQKKEEYRNDYRKWWNKEHRKEWKMALENARKGIFNSRQPEPERKIIVV